MPIRVYLYDATSPRPAGMFRQIIKRCTFTCRPTHPSTNITEPPTVTLGAKLMGTLRSFTLPKHTFHLDACLPGAGDLSQPIPITIFLKHSSPKIEAPACIPRISLLSFSLSLKPRTFVRALPTDETTDQRYVTASGSLHKRWDNLAIKLAELEQPILDMPEQLSLAECTIIRWTKIR